jgi:hypothetical protein
MAPNFLTVSGSLSRTRPCGHNGLVRAAGVRHLLDVRVHNSSQLAGFTKAGDLPFFLSELCGASYTHQPLLAYLKGKYAPLYGI